MLSSLKLPKVVLTFALMSSAFAYETLEGLNQDFAVKKLEAVQQYLKEKPQAADIEDAKDQCIYIMLSLGKQTEAFPLLQEKYEFLIKEPEQNLKKIFGEIVPILLEAYSNSGKKQEAEAFIEKAKIDFASHKLFAQISNALDRLRASLNQPAVGEAMDIKFTALDNTVIDLSGMKNKVVLVDFWATWCGPCVQELPNVKAAYEKHHAEGFEIIGISLDQDQNALKEFLTAQQMNWPQHFDGKGWENEFAKKFGIASIPATFLIGKDGTIVATNLRGPALEQKVAELLKKG
jgi:thiol-disulfide isomerase/thioredoxin